MGMIWQAIEKSVHIGTKARFVWVTIYGLDQLRLLERIKAIAEGSVRIKINMHHHCSVSSRSAHRLGFKVRRIKCKQTLYGSKFRFIR